MDETPYEGIVVVRAVHATPSGDVQIDPDATAT
jgi:hypothetical protein